MTAAGAVEGMTAQQGGGILTVFGQIGKRDAVIGEYGVDVVRDRLNQGVEEGGSGLDVGPLHQLSEGELGSAINGDKEAEFALGGAHLGEIDMEASRGDKP